MSAEPQCSGCWQRDEIILELRTVVAQLQARVAGLEQQVRELQARLHQDSSNSSRPPSSDPPQAPRRPSKEPTGRKPGGQPGHPGHARPRLPPDRVNQIMHYWPVTCERCQAALPQVPQVNDPEPTWHQVAEVPLTPAVVTEHQAHGSHCPDCGHCTWAEIPANVRAHGFGPNLTALAAYRSVFCRGSKRIIEEFMETVFGVPLSLGTIANLEQETSAALRVPYQEAQQAVQSAAVKNTDETGWPLTFRRGEARPASLGEARNVKGWRQANQKRWLWMAATQSIACFKICVGRGKAALGELLGEGIQGVVCSDRGSAYNPLDLAFRQRCWSHRIPVLV